MSTTSSSTRASILTLAATALTTFCSPTVPTVSGDVITAVWNHDLSFSYEIIHMPDLDQRRAAGPGIFGLPNDGAMYCVPTSTMNMFMYAANHGFAGIVPGPGNWQSNDLYNLATLAIDLLGDYMDTDPFDGTGGFDALEGAEDWLDISADGHKLTVELKFHTSFLGPNLNYVAKAGINGHLVSFAYGFYKHIGTHEGLPYYERNGGHMVTLAKAFRDGTDQQVWVRDPADDALDLMSQSKFTNRLWNVTGHSVYVKIKDEPHLRLFSALGYQAPPANVRFIDTMLILRPKAGYSFKQQGGLWKLLQHSPWKFIGTNPSPSAAGIALGLPGAFIHGTINVSGTEAFAISQVPGAPNRIFKVDTVGQHTTPIGDFPGSTHLALSPKGRLYVLSPTHLHCIDLMEDGAPVKMTALPFSSVAFNYDSLRDEVVAVSISQQALLRYAAEDIMQPPIVVPLPPPIVVEGQIALAVCPMTGMWWLGGQIGDTLYGFMFDDAGAPIVEQATVPGLPGGFPTSFDFDDAGHLFVSDGMVLVEMHKTPFAGWQPVMDSPFAGMSPGPVFRMTRSETNFDPNFHIDGYFNIHPDNLEFGEEVFDCYADLDGDGGVGVADVLLMLGAWGECGDGPCPADLTGDRMVGVGDLLVLLGEWGPCP